MIKSKYKIRAKGRKRRESHWGGQRSRAPHSPAGPEQISPLWQVLRRQCVQCPPGPASWRSPALPSAPPCWGAGGPRGPEVSRPESSQLASWSAWCRCPGPAGNDRAIREERQRTLMGTGKVSGEGPVGQQEVSLLWGCGDFGQGTHRAGTGQVPQGGRAPAVSKGALFVALMSLCYTTRSVSLMEDSCQFSGAFSYPNPCSVLFLQGWRGKRQTSTSRRQKVITHLIFLPAYFGTKGRVLSPTAASWLRPAPQPGAATTETLQFPQDAAKQLPQPTPSISHPPTRPNSSSCPHLSSPCTTTSSTGAASFTSLSL